MDDVNVGNVVIVVLGSLAAVVGFGVSNNKCKWSEGGACLSIFD